MAQKPANENAPTVEDNTEIPQGDPASAGALPAEASVESQLADEVSRLQEELGKMRDQWIRAAAECENIRKRASRDQEETSRYAVTAFARDMVSVLENLKRASVSLPLDARGDNELLRTFGEGVDLTLQELVDIFKKYGIERIDPNGDKFDHNFHQAVAQVDRDDVPPGTVVQVVQAGYVISGRLLRPAMVVVSKQGGDAPKQVDTTA